MCAAGRAARQPLSAARRAPRPRSWPAGTSSSRARRGRPPATCWRPSSRTRSVLAELVEPQPVGLELRHDPGQQRRSAPGRRSGAPSERAAATTRDAGSRSRGSGAAVGGRGLDRWALACGIRSSRLPAALNKRRRSIERRCVVEDTARRRVCRAVLDGARSSWSWCYPTARGCRCCGDMTIGRAPGSTLQLDDPGRLAPPGAHLHHGTARAR